MESLIIFSIILIGSIHYVFEYSQIISYAISLLSTINNFNLFSSRINIKFNSLIYPIILIFFNVVFLILLNLIKNQDIGFYSLKFVQILIFILPAYFLGWNYDQIRKKVTIQTVLSMMPKTGTHVYAQGKIILSAWSFKWIVK